MSAGVEPKVEDRMRAVAERQWSQRVVDWLFGYDYFISYRWSDGRSYAVALAEQLQQAGFDCFLDSQEYLKGENWKKAGERSLRKTSRLVLVGSPEVHQSQPVLRELRIFTAAGKHVIPIDFEGSLTDCSDSPLWRYLDRDSLWIKENRDQLGHGPSTATVEALRDSFNLQRQRHKRLRLLRIVLVVFTLLAVSVVASTAWVVRRLPEVRIGRVQAALEASGLTVERSDANGVPRFEVKASDRPITNWSAAGQHLAVLERYGTVTSVNLDQSRIGDLAPLVSVPSVEELHLWAANLSDLTPLQRLPEVRTLVLNANPELDDDDLACLSGMPRLTTLDLFGCRRITDQGLSHLRALPLEVLLLDSCQQITAAGVCQLRRSSIRELGLKGTAVVPTRELVEFVARCPNLKQLSISHASADSPELIDLRRVCEGRGMVLNYRQSATWKTTGAGHRRADVLAGTGMPCGLLSLAGRRFLERRVDWFQSSSVAERRGAGT